MYINYIYLYTFIYIHTKTCTDFVYTFINKTQMNRAIAAIVRISQDCQQHTSIIMMRLLFSCAAFDQPDWHNRFWLFVRL